MRNLDPRTKIVIIVCISAVAMMTKRIGFLAGLLAATLIIMALMGISPRRQWKQLTAIGGMVIFLFVLQAIFGHWQLGLVLCIRLVILLMSALILLTGQPRDYLLAMVQCHMPYELAYMVILAFHFFPILREEAQDVSISMQLRGTELQKTSLKNKLTAYRKMCLPILAGAMKRAKDTAIAMEARAFRAKAGRTYMRRLKLRARDVVIMILIPLLSAGFVWGTISWHGNDSQFLVVGDVQYVIRDRDYEIWGDSMEEAAEENSRAAFALFMGDMVNNPADEKDWKAFLENEERAFGSLKIYTTPGNHETSVRPDRYLEKLDVPGEFYSFDYENCHIVSLNSCIFMDERMAEPGYQEELDRIHDWLAKDLSESEADWKIVFMHHPAYPIADDSKVYDRIRENWEQIFINEGVDVCLCGHQHAYMRTAPMGGEDGQGVTYIMSNSGQKPSHYMDEKTGIPSYVECLKEEPVYLRVSFGGNEVTGKRLKIEAINADGEVIDKHEVRK